MCSPQGGVQGVARAKGTALRPAGSDLSPSEGTKTSMFPEVEALDSADQTSSLDRLELVGTPACCYCTVRAEPELNRTCIIS